MDNACIMNQQKPSTNGIVEKPVSLETSVAIVITEIGHIKTTLDNIDRQNQQNVTRSAWEQRNQYVDEKFVALANAVTTVKGDNAKEFAEVWAEIKSKKVPWTSTGAFIVAAIGLLLIVIPKFSV